MKFIFVEKKCLRSCYNLSGKLAIVVGIIELMIDLVLGLHFELGHREMDRNMWTDNLKYLWSTGDGTGETKNEIYFHGSLHE